MPYEDLCAELFDGTVAAGAFAQGPQGSQSIAPSIENPAREASMALDPRLRILEAPESFRTSPVSSSASGPPSSAATRSHKRKRGGDTGAEIASALGLVASEMRRRGDAAEAAKEAKTTVQQALETLFKKNRHKSADWRDKASSILINETKASIWLAAAEAGEQDAEDLIEIWIQKHVNF